VVLWKEERRGWGNQRRNSLRRGGLNLCKRNNARVGLLGLFSARVFLDCSRNASLNSLFTAPIRPSMASFRCTPPPSPYLLPRYHQPHHR
jgi:hypothetical protein